jgi:LuxR family maltose regulon positive regulatory protein
MPAVTQPAMMMRPGQGEVVDMPATDQAWVAAALLLRAIARDALGDPDAAERVLQRALDLTETDQTPLPLLIDPSPDAAARVSGKPNHPERAMSSHPLSPDAGVAGRH